MIISNSQRDGATKSPTLSRDEQQTPDLKHKKSEKQDGDSTSSSDIEIYYHNDGAEQNPSSNINHGGDRANAQFGNGGCKDSNKTIEESHKEEEDHPENIKEKTKTHLEEKNLSVLESTTTTVEVKNE